VSASNSLLLYAKVSVVLTGVERGDGGEVKRTDNWTREKPFSTHLNRTLIADLLAVCYSHNDIMQFVFTDVSFTLTYICTYV